MNETQSHFYSFFPSRTPRSLTAGPRGITATGDRAVTAPLCHALSWKSLEEGAQRERHD